MSLPAAFALSRPNRALLGASGFYVVTPPDSCTVNYLTNRQEMLTLVWADATPACDPSQGTNDRLVLGNLADK